MDRFSLVRDRLGRLIMNKADKKSMREDFNYVLLKSALRAALQSYCRLTGSTNGLFENDIAKTLAEDIGGEYKFMEFHRLIEKTDVLAHIKQE